MKNKRYVLSLTNLSVVLTPNKQLWDIVVVLNSTKEVWLTMNKVKPNQIDLVVDKLRGADNELGLVYLKN
jgi:regulation of enolase protein 1 (concanavalin A-like superfamily)